MNVSSVLFFFLGAVISILGALKMSAAFKGQDIAPEVVADATVCIISAIMSFWLSRRLWKRKTSRP